MLTHQLLYFSPNCYTYPYDDISSTFTCQKTVNGFNTQNYTVTLCPNGVSWGGAGGTGTQTTTTASSSPTSSAGKCAGTSYTSSQVCDNGHICPSGQYYCNGSCYDPASKCCSGGSQVASSGTCSCNGQVFSGSNYVCDNSVLCPKGTYDCAGACYSPSSYSCCNGGLTAVGQGCWEVLFVFNHRFWNMGHSEVIIFWVSELFYLCTVMEVTIIKEIHD